MEDEGELRAAEARMPFDSLSLERTTCFGTCPAYVLVLHRDGTAEYRGGHFAPRVGTWRGHPGSASFARIAWLIQTSGVLRGAGRYAANWTDDATAIVRVWKTGERRPVEISDYGEQGPLELWTVRSALDGVGARARWRCTGRVQRVDPSAGWGLDSVPRCFESTPAQAPRP